MSIKRQVIIHVQVCTKAKMVGTLAILTLGKSNGNVTNATSYFRILNFLEIIRLDRTPIKSVLRNSDFLSDIVTYLQ